MRRIYKLSIAGMAAALASACSGPDAVNAVTTPPTAGIRFINAVTDTGGATGLDFRFIDFVENNAQPGMTFRGNPTIGDTPAWTGSTKIEYKAAVAGSRMFRIFLSDTAQAVASTVINTKTLPIDASSSAILPNDSTLVLGAGKNYTIIIWGEARTGSANPIHMTAWEENVADPGASVAMRLINATPGTISGTATAGAATVANFGSVAPYSMSAYQTTAPGNTTTPITYNITGFATLTGVAMPGIPHTVDQIAVPGVTIAGSGVTGIVWPRTIAGTKTPQTTGSSTIPSYAAPALTFIWDRRPPKGCSDVIC